MANGGIAPLGVRTGSGRVFQNSEIEPWELEARISYRKYLAPSTKAPLKALKTELSGEPLTQVLAIFVQKLRPKFVDTCGRLIILVLVKFLWNDTRINQRPPLSRTDSSRMWAPYGGKITAKM